MIYAGDRQRILAKLISACCDLEDALTQSAPGARYDPVVMPQGLRNELAVVRDGLARVIRRLEEHPDAGRVKGLPPPLHPLRQRLHQPPAVSDLRAKHVTNQSTGFLDLGDREMAMDPCSVAMRGDYTGGFENRQML